jgi:hypothetical protein
MGRHGLLAKAWRRPRHCRESSAAGRLSRAGAGSRRGAFDPTLEFVAAIGPTLVPIVDRSGCNFTSAASTCPLCSESVTKRGRVPEMDVSGCKFLSILSARTKIFLYVEISTSTHSRRLNVLGFLNKRNDLCPYVIEGKVDTSAIVECFEQFSKQVKKRTYVFLENAPIHRSQEFIRHRAKWVKRGLIIQYLPPYSPELNLIEILWRFMKYHWIPFSAYMSFQSVLSQFSFEVLWGMISLHDAW